MAGDPDICKAFHIQRGFWRGRIYTYMTSGARWQRAISFEVPIRK